MGARDPFRQLRLVGACAFLFLLLLPGCATPASETTSSALPVRSEYAIDRWYDEWIPFGHANLTLAHRPGFVTWTVTQDARFEDELPQVTTYTLDLATSRVIAIVGNGLEFFPPGALAIMPTAADRGYWNALTEMVGWFNLVGVQFTVGDVWPTTWGEADVEATRVEGGWNVTLGAPCPMLCTEMKPFSTQMHVPAFGALPSHVVLRNGDDPIARLRLVGTGGEQVALPHLVAPDLEVIPEVPRTDCGLLPCAPDGDDPLHYGEMRDALFASQEWADWSAGREPVLQDFGLVDEGMIVGVLGQSTEAAVSSRHGAFRFRDDVTESPFLIFAVEQIRLASRQDLPARVSATYDGVSDFAVAPPGAVVDYAPLIPAAWQVVEPGDRIHVRFATDWAIFGPTPEGLPLWFVLGDERAASFDARTGNLLFTVPVFRVGIG